ncbi:type I-F CRISPR-associated endoribonuclease Cas6/Csy4 [Niveibacterium terrae]|uniref:type I-F CRISPR-associated endoribonuclease Cas6/Csy4 n=1 Tax=Niveibacterium terrae TaxID=3373598 RepID=UPI003A90B447
MDHYLDIRVRPDTETTTAHLLNALAGKLHRALVTLQSEDIGISFPRFRAEAPSLGEVLRVHGSRARLQQLVQLNWLLGVADHVAVGEVLPVPGQVGHRVVRRVQAQSNAQRLRRRYIKRHNCTEEEALERIPDSVEKTLHLPFLALRSQSTGQPFLLFVEHLAVQDQPVPGVFNAYGLGASATIPWF